MEGTVATATEEGAAASTDEAPEPAKSSPPTATPSLPSSPSPAIQQVKALQSIAPAISSTTTEIPHDTTSTEITTPIVSTDTTGVHDDANATLDDGAARVAPPYPPCPTSLAEVGEIMEIIEETESPIARHLSRIYLSNQTIIFFSQGAACGRQEIGPAARTLRV